MMKDKLINKKHYSFEQLRQEFYALKNKIYMTYGKSRVHKLIDHELQLRYERALVTYTKNIWRKNKQKELVAMMIRAFDAIEKNLIEKKIKPLNSNEYFLEVNNNKFIIVLDQDYVQKAYKKYKNEDCIIISLKEIILLLDNNFIELKKQLHTYGPTIEKYENKCKQ